MRIAMLSWRSPDNPRSGGAETLTFEILKRAASRGHEVTWFAARSAGSPETELIDGVRFVRLGRQWTVHVRAWRWLRARLDQFDVVVDQVNTLPFLTPWYVPETKRRLLIFQLAREYWWRETRGLFRLVAPLGYWTEPRYVRLYRATDTITISESTKADLVALGIPATRISLVTPAITAPLVTELRPKPEPFRVIVIGRLTPAKFLEEAIGAFALVQRSLPEAQLDIVGAGDPRYQSRLEQDVSRRGLAGFVTFHGRAEEARKCELLERAHVHLFTSHREGWGLTVNEAGARGTPTVGYDAPGVRDSVADPRLLAPLTSGASGLAERVLALQADPALYADVRARAWQIASGLSYEAATGAFLEAVGA